MKKYLCIEDYEYPGFCHYKAGDLYISNGLKRELRFNNRITVQFTKYSWNKHFKEIKFKYGK